VEWILVAGAGHQWPGSAGSGARGADTVSTALDATAVIWGFFTQHRRP
jgi:polyhydroxybutyrate depolymerase